jgi:hypothetical protein
MGRTQIGSETRGGLRGWFKVLRSLLDKLEGARSCSETKGYYGSVTDIETVASAFQSLVSQVTRDGNELSELYLEAEKRAAGSALLNETIVESVTSGIIVIEKGGTVRLVNSSARWLLRLGEDVDVVGRRLGTLFLDGEEMETLAEEDMRHGKQSSRRVIHVLSLDGKKRKLGVSTSCVRPGRDSEAHALIAVFTVLDESPDGESARAAVEAEHQGYLRGVLDSYDLMSDLMLGFGRIEEKSAGGSLTKAELAEFSTCLRRTCETMMAFALSLEASSSLTELVDVNSVINSILRRRAIPRTSLAGMDLCSGLPGIKTIRKVLETGLELLIAGCVAESASGIGIRTGPASEGGIDAVEICIREFSRTKPVLKVDHSLRELVRGEDLRREAGLFLLASLPRESHQVEAQKVEGLFHFSVRLLPPIKKKAGKSQEKGDTIERKE